MCMKRQGVSRETGFPARRQLTENRKGSVLALSRRPLLPHDVYDGKAIECERGVPAPLDKFVHSSLSRGYNLVIGEQFCSELGGRLPGRVPRGTANKATCSFQETVDPSLEHTTSGATMRSHYTQT